ncbi:MAG: SCP2 sterol-binding domain-containing protein [Nevskia sp.]
MCAAVEVALNRTLRLERGVIEDCAKLEGRVIALHVADLDWTFVIEPHAGGVRVAAETERAPDVRVSAPSLRLLRLALSTVSGREGLPTGLAIAGDTELLNRFNGLLLRVGFDPEELVARLIGEGAAHRLVGGVKGFLGWGRHAADRLSLDTAEFLTEETGDLARAADIEEWLDAVDALREGADRLEARLAAVERKAAE